MSAALATLYQQFRYEHAGQMLRDLGNTVVSPPLLLNPFPGYDAAPQRLVYVGQATGGWGWHAGYKEYPEWTGPPIESLADFVQRGSAVAELMAGYRLFEHCGRQRATPFWRFHRRLLAGLGLPTEATIWTNAYRVDVNGKIPYGLVAEVVERYQSGLLRSELDLLKPSVAVFATSWSLDGLIERELGPVTWSPVAGFDPRLLSEFRLTTTGLRGWRTYHPQYLQRAKQFDRVAESILDRMYSYNSPPSPSPGKPRR